MFLFYNNYTWFFLLTDNIKNPLFFPAKKLFYSNEIKQFFFLHNKTKKKIPRDKTKILMKRKAHHRNQNTIITIHILSAIVIFSGNTCIVLKVVVFFEQNFLSANPACYQWSHVQRTHFVDDQPIFSFFSFFLVPFSFSS